MPPNPLSWKGFIVTNEDSAIKSNYRFNVPDAEAHAFGLKHLISLHRGNRLFFRMDLHVGKTHGEVTKFMEKVVAESPQSFIVINDGVVEIRFEEMAQDKVVQSWELKIEVPPPKVFTLPDHVKLASDIAIHSLQRYQLSEAKVTDYYSRIARLASHASRLMDALEIQKEENRLMNESIHGLTGHVTKLQLLLKEKADNEQALIAQRVKIEQAAIAEKAELELKISQLTRENKISQSIQELLHNQMGGIMQRCVIAENRLFTMNASQTDRLNTIEKNMRTITNMNSKALCEWLKTVTKRAGMPEFVDLIHQVGVPRVEGVIDGADLLKHPLLADTTTRKVLPAVTSSDGPRSGASKGTAATLIANGSVQPSADFVNRPPYTAFSDQNTSRLSTLVMAALGESDPAAPGPLVGRAKRTASPQEAGPSKRSRTDGLVDLTSPSGGQ